MFSLLCLSACRSAAFKVTNQCRVYETVENLFLLMGVQHAMAWHTACKFAATQYTKDVRGMRETILTIWTEPRCTSRRTVFNFLGTKRRKNLKKARKNIPCVFPVAPSCPPFQRHPLPSRLKNIPNLLVESPEHDGLILHYQECTNCLLYTV